MIFHWLMMVIVIAYGYGTNIDASQHIHRGNEIETFFNPSHYLMYAGWLGVGIALATYAVIQFRKGKERSEWLPNGYWASAVGFVIFSIGGGFDLAWHELYGFEANLEAPVSPAHMVLIVGSIFMYSGVLLHSLYRRRQEPHLFENRINLHSLPLVLSISLILQSTAWPTWYFDPLTVDYASGGLVASGKEAFQFIEFGGPTAEIAGMEGFFLLSLITVPFMIYPLKKWRLPNGALTLILMYFYGSRAFSTNGFVYLPAVLAGSISGELIWAWIRRGGEARLANPIGYRAIALVTPLLLYTVYFAIIAARGGIVWAPHLWVGAITYGGMAGLAVSLVVIPPTSPGAKFSWLSGDTQSQTDSPFPD